MMAKSSSTIQLDPLNNDDPFFLAYLSELGTWDSVVTNRSFMEVLKDDDGNDIQDDKDESKVDSHRRKKAKTEADVADDSGGSSSDSGGDHSCSSSSVPTESIEIVSRTPEDMEMVNVPPQLYGALGDIDMKFLRHLLENYFDENCTYVTTTGGPAIVGRDNLYDVLRTMVDRTPDAVHAIRNCRVVKDAAGNKALKFKVFTTATYIRDKNDGNDAVPNLQAKTVTSHLDESSISKKEIASIKESLAAAGGATSIYSLLAHCSCCWHLNEQGKVQHFDTDYKLLSMKPFTKSARKLGRY